MIHDITQDFNKSHTTWSYLFTLASEGPTKMCSAFSLAFFVVVVRQSQTGANDVREEP